MRRVLRGAGIALGLCLAALAAVALRLAVQPAEEAVPSEPGPHRVALVETRPVVPGPGLPEGLALGAANNNLDALRHTDGFVYLAFRTAPHHFANPDTAIVVLRSRDEETWQQEARFAEGTDLREPRLLSVGDRLLLYVSRLGQDPLAFEPQGMAVAERDASGAWSALEDFGAPEVMGWRARQVEDAPTLIVYRGGGDIYHSARPELAVEIWRSEDGRRFSPFDPEHPVTYRGGGSEADFGQAGDGRWYGVIRNEAGDETGWGALVCVAPEDAPARWECTADPRKYDSPFVFVHDGEVYLLGRRNLRGDGRYDLGIGPRSGSLRVLRTVWNQLNYSLSRKRCALWRFVRDEAEPRLAFVLDLPSRGDTCFTAALPGPGPDEWTVYDYTSPLDGPDPRWIQGQRGGTVIVRHRLRFARAAGR